MIEVIEVDQWSSTGDIDKWTFEEFKEIIENLDEGYTPSISGGDAEAIQKIFGGTYRVREVSEDDSPRKGNVWYRESPEGELERWKHNYATR